MLQNTIDNLCDDLNKYVLETVLGSIKTQEEILKLENCLKEIDVNIYDDKGNVRQIQECIGEAIDNLMKSKEKS